MKYLFPPASLGLPPLLQFSSILLQEPEHSQPPARGGVADRQPRRRDSRGRPGQRGPGSAGQSPASRFPGSPVPQAPRASGRLWEALVSGAAAGGGAAQAGVPAGTSRGATGLALGRLPLRPPGPGTGAPGPARHPHPQRRAAPAPLPVAGGYEWAQRKHRPPRT